VTLAGVAGLHLQVGLADDSRQLRVFGNELVEFQNQVGDRVFFSEASAELGARGRTVLEAQAAWLARHPALAVVIEGHADDAGAHSHNLELSERRADAVRRRLIQMGIAPERIRTVAYGRERQVADCAALACAAQNRRAVTVIVRAAGSTDAVPAPAARNTAARRFPRWLH
jgi:peptidoglycan-associated lipoprotein